MISDKYNLLSSNKAQSFNENSWLIRFYTFLLSQKVFLWNELAHQLFIGGPLLNIRAWVGVEMVGVLGALREPELGVDLEGVEPWEGVHGRAVWCGALLMEALYGGQSLRPEVALRRVEEQQEVKESDVCEEEPGCLGWSLRL